jgi:hypothetical protein
MAKKKAKKKKVAKKKAGRKTCTRVASSQYTIAWNKPRTKCVLEHKGGIGGESSMGATDVPILFKCGKRMCLLSVNYLEGYACMECFVDDEGVDSMCFADSNDCRKLFGKNLTSVSPKKIAERLLKECC